MILLPVSREYIGSRRRDDNDERQVGNRKIQQQEVDYSAHALFGNDDVDDETVSGDTEGRHDAVENGNHHLVQDE